jgi:serine/threonine protein phosphatase PrpC
MIRTRSFSAAGGHPVNEDAFIVQRIPGGTDAWFVVLADGQGGRAGGARAAQLACRTTSEFVLTHPGTVLGDPDSWVGMLGRTDEVVAADPEAGFTTLVGLCVEADHVAGASCGDSAAVAVCRGCAPRVLTAHQFKDPPVGSGEALFIPFELEMAAPWRVLVMSDGVWKYASWDRVWDCAARLSGDELIEELQTAARLRTTGEFPDDFTVVLLEGE